MRRGRGDQLSQTRSRPAYIDEFERKLAAALAKQPDARKTRFGSARSSDAIVEVPSSPSLGKAITPRSMGEEQPAKVEQPSSETRETRTQFSSAEPTVSPQGDSAHDAAKAPAAGGTADVRATQPSARLSDLAETSSARRALKSRTESSESSPTHEAPPAVTHALPRGNGNGPTQEIGAAGPVDSKTQQTVDVEALLADVEALLANDAEVAQVVKPANLHARPVAEVIKRFSRDWKLAASACAFVIVAMVGVVTLSHGMLAVPNTPPRADEPSVRETVTRDDSAEQTLKDRALEPSSAAEDRLGANSDGVGATASAPQANETPGAGATQATIGLTNGAPPGSTPEASDPTGPTSPLAPPAQPSGYKPASADRTATATSSLAPPAQSSDLKPAPTLSPLPAPTPTSGTFPTDGWSADHAPQPSPKPERNVHDVGTTKLSAPRRDVPTKVVGKPSIGATITKNDATSTPAVTEKSNQPLPVGTPTNPEKTALASNVVQSPPAADPGASARQPLDHPTHAVGRGVVLAQHADDPAASGLRHAIGGIFGTGNAPAQHSVDPTLLGD